MFLILDQYPSAFSLRLKDVAERKGHRTVLLTSADVARDAALVFHLSQQETRLRLRCRDAVVETSDIEGVYCGINAFEAGLWERFTPGDAEYAARETQALWLAILAGLPCHVVNRPALDSLAGTLLSTPEMLYLAHRLGFRVPMVISLESGKVAAEVLGAGVPARYADLGEARTAERGLSRNDLSRLERNDDHFRVLEEVPGKAIYVTLLGDRFFACETLPGGAAVPVAVRDIPRPVKTRLRTLQKRLNLALAEHAFRVTADGTWVFLGCARPPAFAVAAHGDAFFEHVVDYAVEKGE